MIPEELHIHENELFQDYINRLINIKLSKIVNITWQQMSDLIKEETGVSRSERTLRNYARTYKEDNSDIDITKRNLSDLIFLYKKERAKLSDERTQNNAFIRRLSREETLYEIAEEAVKNISNQKTLLPAKQPNIGAGYNEAICMISDWHYGLDFINDWNTFNLDICKNRIKTLLLETISFCYTHGVNKLHLVNLGDLVAGRIHNTIKLQSRIDAVTQIMEISEILAEFISSLTNNSLSVTYYDCLDNHSRVEPNKADSLDIESFARMISWYLKLRLKDNKNVIIEECNINKDILTFEVCNGKYKVGGVHGHKDKANKLVDNLCMINKLHYDLLLSAHNHHPHIEEKNEVMWISNGSLMGSDSYSCSLRLTSKPSQTLILCNENSVCDYIHIVNL